MCHLSMFHFIKTEKKNRELPEIKPKDLELEYAL